MKREKLASSHRGPRLWEPWRAFEDFEHLGNHRVGAEKEEANIDRRRRLHSCRRTNKQKQYHWKFGAKPDSIASNTPIRAVHSKWICQQKKTSWLWAVKFWIQFKSSNYHSLHIKQYEARCSWHSQGLKISCVSTFKVFEFHQKCCQYHLFTKSLSMSLSLSLWSL